MADILVPDLLNSYSGQTVQTRLVDMGDGTYAPLALTRLTAGTALVGTVNLGGLGGAATAANQSVGNAALTALAAPYTAAQTSALTATIGDSAAHLLGPFAPQLAREIWLTLNATATATGTAQVLRSTDGGATRLALTALGSVVGSFAFAGASGAIANEIVSVETDASAAYFVAITLQSGTVAVRLAQ